MIYLDYNATAPMRPEVQAAMQEVMAMPLNPSSVHFAGRKARRLLEDARHIVADHVSCFAGEIIFTASGSEANNMALRGFADLPLLVAASEHASVLETARRLGGDILSVEANGLLKLDLLETKLQALGRPALVSVMLANNETGVIQPIKDIAVIVHRYDGLLHCDAVQAIGKMPVDVNLLDADMITLGAHKFGGPLGIGALVVRGERQLRPLLTGGSQEMKRRAGTEAVAAAVGFAKALEVSDGNDCYTLLAEQMQFLYKSLKQAFPPLRLAGEDAPRMGHVLNIMLPGVSSETQLMHLDLSGVCVSAGSACSSGRIAASHVLLAMGFSEEEAGSAIRISGGWNTQCSELDSFQSMWLEMAVRLTHSR